MRYPIRVVFVIDEKGFLWMMKFLVGMILFLNVWLWADTEIPYSAETISQFKGLRNSLLESLRNKKSDEVVLLEEIRDLLKKQNKK